MSSLEWIAVIVGAWLAFDLLFVVFLVIVAERRRWAAARRRRRRGGYVTPPTCGVDDDGFGNVIAADFRRPA